MDSLPSFNSYSNSNSPLKKSLSDTTNIQNLSSILNNPHTFKSTDPSAWIGWWASSTTLAPPDFSPILPKQPPPDISRSDFLPYLSSVSDIYSRFEDIKNHTKNNDLDGESNPDLADGESNSDLATVGQGEALVACLREVPALYFKEDFALEDGPTFHSACPFSNAAENLMLQEKLSQYLDVVELHLVKEISLRSNSFFEAQGQLEDLNGKIVEGCERIRELKETIKVLDKDLVDSAREIHELNVSRGDLVSLQNKLRLILYVNQALSTLKLLVASADCAGALDVTDDLQQFVDGDELTGLHCFRHLRDHVAAAIESINSILSAEFMRASIHGAGDKDLLLLSKAKARDSMYMNGIDVEVKLDDEEASNFRDHLLPLIVGLLRTAKLPPVLRIYRDTLTASMKTTIKNAVAELLPTFSAQSLESDLTPTERTADTDGGGLSLASKLRSLSSENFVLLLSAIFNIVQAHLVRAAEVKKAIEWIMCSVDGHYAADSVAAAIAVGAAAAETAHESDGLGPFSPLRSASKLASSQLKANDAANPSNISRNFRADVLRENAEAVFAACDAAHGRWAKLLGVRALLHPKLRLVEFLSIYNITQEFITATEKIGGRLGYSIRGTMQSQAKAFVDFQHEMRMTKIKAVLDQEMWVEVDVPEEFQAIVASLFYSECLNDTQGDATTSYGEVGTSNDGSLVIDAEAQNAEQELVKMNSTDISLENSVQKKSTPSTESTESNKVIAATSSAQSNNHNVKERGKSTSQTLFCGGVGYHMVNCGLILLKMLSEYMDMNNFLPTLSSEVVHRVVEILKFFNTRTCQLILGAGAMQVSGLKSITSKHLALASQVIGFVYAIIPEIRRVLFLKVPEARKVLLLSEIDRAEKRKAATLSALASSKTDKSPKGTLDTHIIPLINTINSHPSYFTTSSCSGRISILSQPKRTSTPPTSKKKARGGSWLYISHDLANPNSLLPLLFPTESPSESTEFPTESASSADGPSESATVSVTELVLRFEPLIIAVECKDIEAAQCLVSFAIRSGFRESGITSANNKRVVAGIRCSIRMEVPLGDSDRILVSEEYVKFLVDLANQKMEANWKRTQGFLSGLIDNGFQTHAVSENGECRDGDDDQSERTSNGDAHIGMVGGGEKAADCSLPVSSILVAGEPIEKLLLWGHSTCVLDNDSYKSVLVFGGFGGIGRHARRNDCFLLDPFSGKLNATDVEGAPSPRLGHTASLVGDLVFIIGGRADPSNILNDVWVLNTANMEWKLIQCTGSVFSPRHRHAAAAVGSNIYVYGGLNNNDTILSSLHVLNTGDLQWKEVSSDGEQPCARHSHSMLAYGSKVFVFGGYNGQKALGDLYSFDVQTCTWELEKTAGRSPHARFSHSMFVYKDFLGVIGGCPVGQHFQELALLDLQFNIWKQITLDYIGKELLVRTTANVVGDDLVIIGGGAACYAFGTKFSKPFKVNLLPLVPLGDKLMPTEKNANASVTHAENAEVLTQSPVLNSEAEKHQLVSYNRVLQLEKKYAKMGKDILKNFGWLDLGRKVYTKEDGLYICFPITEKFSAMFLEKQDQYVEAFEEGDDTYVCKPFTGGGVFLNEVSCSIALNFLKKCGATNLANEVGEDRKSSKSPFQTMNESIALLIKQKDLAETLLEELPNRWERLGDIVVLPATSFKDPIWDSISEELWPIVAKSLKARRVARQGRVASTGTRDSTLEILIGDNGWVDHRENGILYSFNATKCMFSWGNLSEKLRMGNLECKDEVIVDLFAGIGYFTLPFLVRAKAKLVCACEWNPHAVEALRRNLELNSVSDRCIVLEGDNRMTAPKGIANRVCLGLLPTSEDSWATAVRALRSEGGMLHVHGNVKDSQESLWTAHLLKSIDEIARSEGHRWEVSIEHVERVKWYAPHIRHLVADVRCSSF